MEYPAAPRGSSTDTFQSAQHGTVELLNPYAWLEDTSSVHYSEFIAAQNARSESFINEPSSAPNLKSLETLLKKLHSLPSLASPFYSCGGHYYYRVAGQGKVFPIWYKIKKGYVDGASGENVVELAGKSEVFHDELSEMSAVISSGFSSGGKYWAYSSSIHGSEWTKIHIRNCVTGDKLQDEIIDTKFTAKAAQISWLGDAGFFYQYWPDKTSGLNPQLRFHLVGEDQGKDVVVHEDKNEPTSTFCVRTEGECVMLFVFRGGRSSEVKAGIVVKEFLTGSNRDFAFDFDVTVAGDFESEWE